MSRTHCRTKVLWRFTVQISTRVHIHTSNTHCVMYHTVTSTLVIRYIAGTHSTYVCVAVVVVLYCRSLLWQAGTVRKIMFSVTLHKTTVKHMQGGGGGGGECCRHSWTAYWGVMTVAAHVHTTVQHIGWGDCHREENVEHKLAQHMHERERKSVCRYKYTVPQTQV